MRLYFCSIDMYCLRFSQNYDFIFNFHHHPAKNLSSPPEEYTQDILRIILPFLLLSDSLGPTCRMPPPHGSMSLIHFR